MCIDPGWNSKGLACLEAGSKATTWTVYCLDRIGEDRSETEHDMIVFCREQHPLK